MTSEQIMIVVFVAALAAVAIASAITATHHVARNHCRARGYQDYTIKPSGEIVCQRVTKTAEPPEDR